MKLQGQYANVLEDLAHRHFDELAITKVEEDHQSLKPGWYAQSSFVGMRIGPMRTKAEADEAMRLSPRSRAQQRINQGTDYPFPHDLKVWEELPKRRKRP